MILAFLCSKHHALVAYFFQNHPCPNTPRLGRKCEELLPWKHYSRKAGDCRAKDAAARDCKQAFGTFQDRKRDIMHLRLLLL